MTTNLSGKALAAGMTTNLSRRALAPGSTSLFPNGDSMNDVATQQGEPNNRPMERSIPPFFQINFSPLEAQSMNMTFKNGYYSTVPHTPSADVAAGDAVNIGTNMVGVAHAPITADEVGAVSVGPAVYEHSRTGINDAVAAGVPVYLDDGALSFTEGRHIGNTVTAADAAAGATDVQTFSIMVNPNGTILTP
jgi:predicted RecA/RadA family phage recombinase